MPLVLASENPVAAQPGTDALAEVERRIREHRDNVHAEEGWQNGCRAGLAIASRIVRETRSDIDSPTPGADIRASSTRQSCQSGSRVAGMGDHVPGPGSGTTADELAALRAAVEALADEWQADLDGGGIRDKDARYCWETAVRELRRALLALPGRDEGGES